MVSFKELISPARFLASTDLIFDGSVSPAILALLCFTLHTEQNICLPKFSSKTVGEEPPWDLPFKKKTATLFPVRRDVPDRCVLLT